MTSSPRLASRLVRAVLGEGIKSEDVLGDLTEQYGRLAVRSRWRAWLWFWAQALSVVAHHWMARERNMAGLFRGVGGDVRYALRGLARSPGFAAAAILTIGLGVGANAAIFSVVDGVLLRPLPWQDPDELVAVWPEKRWSGEMLGEVRERTESFASLAALRGGGYTLLGDGPAERVDGARVSDTYFEVLGVTALRGRTFTEAERYGEGGGVVGRTARRRMSRSSGRAPRCCACRRS
jgi:hypothetical protein